MAKYGSRRMRLATAARWPLGVALTAYRYMWRTTPVHRWELPGALAETGPPGLDPAIDLDGLQLAEHGVGPLVHRLYRTKIVSATLSPEELMQRIGDDLDQIAPSEFASFKRLERNNGRLAMGDEYVVRMPGPWDGPVRVVDATATSFRLATMPGHLEAGQIEFRTSGGHRALHFAIESWARSGDRLSDVLYTHLRMSKEVQLHMWTSVLERVVTLSGGRMAGGIVITTRRLDSGPEGDSGTGRASRRLARLAERPLNFDPGASDAYTPEAGWHRDDMIEPLPGEPSGPPVARGGWEIARDLMSAYQVADPGVVRAIYEPNAPLAGRTMLLEIRFVGLRLHVGVRIGEVYDETRTVDGRRARVFGWYYDTLKGHFEQGRLHYEIWKWLDTGEVEFRLHAYSRVADTGPILTRLGFRLVGRRQQLAFYRQACRRMRRLTEAQLQVDISAPSHHERIRKDLKRRQEVAGHRE